MAIVEQYMAIFGAEASVSVVYDNTNGAISQITWIVNSGTLTVVVKQASKPDIVITKTTSGSQAVPAGYNLTSYRGGWYWTGALYGEFSWHS